MNISTIELLDWLVKASYLVAATLFLLGLQRMASPLTARSGIRWAGLGMLIATVATFFLPELHNIPLILAAVYLTVSAFTFVIYAMDKSAAKKCAWRTSESTLHWLSLFGGWPGALIGQHLLRHKSSKAPFRFVFWVTVVFNVALFIALATPEGQAHWVSW